MTEFSTTTRLELFEDDDELLELYLRLRLKAQANIAEDMVVKRERSEGLNDLDGPPLKKT